MDTINSLQKLGLTENEITVYSYLLRKGVSEAPEIFTDNELDKSSTYEALANLQKKELVYVIGNNRNQKFAAVAPEKLTEILNKKQDELSVVATDIQSFIKNIDEAARQAYKSKNIRVFEGENGFITWSHARLENNSTKLIRELVSFNLHNTYIKDYANYSKDMPKRRVLKNIRMRSLVSSADLSIEPKSLNKSNEQLMKEVRVLPDSFVIPASFSTFGHNSSFLSKKDGKFLGIIIEDRFITTLLNSMYDFIWEQCKIV